MQQVWVVNCHRHQPNTVVNSVKQSFIGNQHSIWTRTIRHELKRWNLKCFEHFHPTAYHPSSFHSISVHFSFEYKKWNIDIGYICTYTSIAQIDALQLQRTFGLTACYWKLLYEIAMHWKHVESSRVESNQTLPNERAYERTNERTYESVMYRADILTKSKKDKQK